MLIKILGGIICLILAEVFRRFSFIAPDWEGDLSQDKLLSFFFLLCGGCCLILAAGLFSEALSQIKERKALERAYLRAKKAEEEERRRQARKMTFRNWRNTVLVLALLCLFSGKVWALDGKDLERVCSRLSQAAGRPVEVVIEQNNDLNAWASSDGRLGVTSGMLEALEEEDELAFVIAHEVSHLQGGHHLRQRTQASLGGLLGTLAAKALGGKEKAVKLGVEIGAGLLASSESRQDEYEADKNALILIQKAGYRPEAAVAVLKRLQSRYGNGDAKVPVIGWFASHPDTGNRIKRLEALLVDRDTPLKSRLQRGRKAVVVVDPEARRYDYGWGFRSYYDESLSEIAKVETEAVLGERGWTVLVSTHDVGPIQEELALENSEWGKKGEGRKDIGYFAGADDIFYVSAYVASETAYTAGNWRQSAQLEGLKVGVVLRQIDLKTRKQIGVFRATGSAQALRRARITLGQGDPLEADFEQADNLARRAVRAAVANALN